MVPRSFSSVRSRGGFLGSIRLAEEFAASRSGVFLPRQFSNTVNTEAHATTTGPEIWSQLELADLRPMPLWQELEPAVRVMGVGRCLRARNPNIKVYPVEAGGIADNFYGT